MTVPPFPLLWPDGQQRTARQEKSAFRTSFDGALKNVRESLRLFAADSGKIMAEVQITSNASWMDNKPTDTGIAVWFTWDGAQRCIAVDRYATVQENLQALHHVLEARRTELRHAGINMVRTTFKGFIAALPSPGMLTCWQILGIASGSTREAIQAAYKAKARVVTGEALQALNVARDEAMGLAQ